MRLIDADALKEDLTRFYDNEVTARDLIDEQPTICGWISVKDRLPELCEPVLLIGKNKYGNWYPAQIGYYGGDEWCVFGHGELQEPPIYWMQRPEPPKEEHDEP
jgi:hypothetical protein